MKKKTVRQNNRKKHSIPKSKKSVQGRKKFSQLFLVYKSA